MTAPSDEALGHQVEAFGRRLEELGATVTPTRIIEAAFRAGFQAGEDMASEAERGNPANCVDVDAAWTEYAAELKAAPGGDKSDLTPARTGERIAPVVTTVGVPKSVWAFPAKGDHFHVRADGMLEASPYQVVEAPVDQGDSWRLTVEAAPGRYAYTPAEPKE